MALQPIPGIQNAPFSVQAPTPTTATTATGALGAISAVAGAFSAYQAGKMRKLAYEHEAAMVEINAKQIEITGMFLIADKTEDLANTLALQNVMAAASGRRGGSLENLEQTSIANLEEEKKRIKVTGRAKQVATLMESETRRAAGKAAATRGLLSGISELSTGVAEASKFIS